MFPRPYYLRKRFRTSSPAPFLVLLFALLFFITAKTQSQSLPVSVTNDPAHRTVTITADGAPFTTFIYPDTLEKPVLYPIYAPDGQLITRGFPVSPRPGEPVDHPHHLGLWFNYESVNGLDFWNNSYAIAANKKSSYGWIRTDSILQAGTLNSGMAAPGTVPSSPGTVSSGRTTPSGTPVSAGTAYPSQGRNANQGILRYAARWTDQQQNLILTEHTTYIFSATRTERIIDRYTTLDANIDVSFPDVKDGMLGLRVTKELQIPSNAPGEFVDDKGIVTKVAAGNTPDINGNYLTSEGKKGDSAWGTRGKWCLLYGKKQQDTLSVAIIDHPGNPGYPTYWHARGYGLFAANPLGQKVFSNGKQTLNYRLEKGHSVTFRYRVVIAAGKQSLSTGRIGQLADAFARIK